MINRPPMRPARLAACVALVTTACIPRVAPDPGPSRAAVSGAPVVFVGPKGLPEGSSVRWSFGDGAAESVGPEVSHAFPRAGNFTVTQTVVDRDGAQRSAATTVTVARRGVAAAVPADVRAALLFERPWGRVKLQREAARRAGLGEFFDETARGLGEALGFDAQDPAQAEQHGVDTDEGVALYTVPQDAEALVVCAGISDPAKAEAALRRLLVRPPVGAPGRATLTGFALREEKRGGLRVVIGERAGGAEKVAFVERLGYLYLRTPGQTDPLLALAPVLKLGVDDGLEKDAAFQAAVARVGQGDAVFYSAAPKPGAGTSDEPSLRAGSRLAGQIGASAFAVQVSEGQLKLSLFSQLRSLTGAALIDALTPKKPPPPLADKLPAGAAAFFKLSGDPKTTWRELQRGLGSDGVQLATRLRELFGAEVETALLPSFTGNGAVAIYLDAQSLIEALLGEQVAAFDRSTSVSVAELAAGQEAPLRAALEHAARDGGGGRGVRGATWWPISEGLQVAIKDGFLYSAIGGVVDEPDDADRGGAKSGPRPWSLRALGPLFAAAVKPASPAVKKKEPAKALPSAAAARGGKGRKPPAPPPEPTAAELGPLAAVLLATPGAPTLAAALATTGLPFDVPNAQLAWFDVRGLVERLDRAAQAQGGMVGAAARLLVDRVRGLRDALVDARPQPDGLAATVTLRFLPDTAPAPGPLPEPGAHSSRTGVPGKVTAGGGH